MNRKTLFPFLLQVLKLLLNVFCVYFTYIVINVIYSIYITINLRHLSRPVTISVYTTVIKHKCNSIHLFFCCVGKSSSRYQLQQENSVNSPPRKKKGLLWGELNEAGEWKYTCMSSGDKELLHKSPQYLQCLHPSSADTLSYRI